MKVQSEFDQHFIGIVESLLHDLKFFFRFFSAIFRICFVYRTVLGEQRGKFEIEVDAVSPEVAKATKGLNSQSTKNFRRKRMKDCDSK